MSDNSTEALKERVETFEVQLKNIELLLDGDPENEEFKNLHRDLLEVITLTKEMLALKTSQEAEEVKDAAYGVGTDVEVFYQSMWCPGMYIYK